MPGLFGHNDSDPEPSSVPGASPLPGMQLHAETKSEWVPLYLVANTICLFSVTQGVFTDQNSGRVQQHLDTGDLEHTII